MNASISEKTISRTPKEPLWQPSAEVCQQANLTHYAEWLKQAKSLEFDGPLKLWEWSVNNLTAFWASIWDYFEVKASEPYDSVLAE